MTDSVPRSDAAENETDAESRHRAVLLFVVVFVAVLTGGIAPQSGPDLRAGQGELTTVVTDQNGDAVAGESIQVLDSETDEVLFEGRTDEDGEIETTLDQGEYDVAVGGETQSVTLGADAEVSFSIDTSPPEARRSVTPSRSAVGW